MDTLAGLIEEVDAQGPATPEQQAEQQQAADADTAASEWGMIAYTIGGALGMLAPELRQVYTEESCLKWGRAVVPVSEKYGWGAPANVPELGLLLCTAGLAVPSILAVRQRLAELKKQQTAQQRKDSVQADAQQGLSPVQPVHVATAGAVSGG